MTDAALRAEARADLERRLETAPYIPLLPADQQGPVGIPAWVKNGDDEFVAIPIPAN